MRQDKEADGGKDDERMKQVNILIVGCLSKLSLARSTIRFAQEENAGDLDAYEINGIETVVNEVYAMLAAAMALECRRPINSVEAV